MRLLRYISLLGLKARDSTDHSSSLTNVHTTANHKSEHIDHHHNHQHTHKSLNPTQRAYVAHLQAKELAQKRMSERVLERRRAPAFREFVVVNHLEDDTVYPAYSSKQQSGGFKLGPKSEHTIYLPPADISTFRLWIRRGCTEGENGKLSCLTGDCHNKLECDSWGKYGSTSFETDISMETGHEWPDISVAEGSTMIPMTFTVNNCLTLTCDPTNVQCPEDMQVKDENGKLLACSCGAKDFGKLQQVCPDHGGAQIQEDWAKACPNIYTYSTQDSEGQKYCPYSEAGMRLDIGKPPPGVTAPAEQIPIEGISDKKMEESKSPERSWWGPGVEGFAEWAAKIESEGKSAKPTVTDGPVGENTPISFEDAWTDSDQWKSWRDAGYPM